MVGKGAIFKMQSEAFKKAEDIKRHYVHVGEHSTSAHHRRGSSKNLT